MSMPGIRFAVSRVGFAVACLAAVLAGAHRFAAPVRAASATIVVSQVYGGGGNSGATLKNDFIELYNLGPVAVDVTGWTVQYASSAGSSWQKTSLTGTIGPGQFYLVQEAAGSGGTVSLPTPNATGSIAMSATAGKVALVANGTTLTGTCPAGLVDFVGFGATTNCAETAPTATLSNTTAAIRKDGGRADTDNNSADFTAGPPTPRTGAALPLALDVAARPSTAAVNWPVLITARVLPGTNPASTAVAVTADLTPIDPGLSASQPLYDDGTNGDVAPSDGTFSFRASVGAVATGPKSISVSASDAQGRSAAGTISLTVIDEPQLQQVSQIQGEGTTSPLVGQRVTTTGIVTGVKYNGYYIQMPGDGDGNPKTSDGIFVYTNASPGAEAVLGNHVKVAGTVREYLIDPPSSLTEIEYLAGFTLPGGSATLPTPRPISPVDVRYNDVDWLEQYEGMRVQVDSLTVVAPTDGNTIEANAESTSNGTFYVVITGVGRPFREPGVDLFATLPPSSPDSVPRFDANPERLRMDSDALGGARLEVAAGQVLGNVTGILDYSYGSYTLLPDASGGYSVTPPAPARGVPAASAGEVTIGSFNLERFYDAVNDPDTADFVLTPGAFAKRVSKASKAIREVLGMPDILGVEEVENLASLEAIAALVDTEAGAAAPHYDAYLEPGNDPGGINVGFLIKHDRFANVSVDQVGKAATYVEPNNGPEALLNDRPPLFLRAEANVGEGPNLPLVVVVNHLRSLIGVDTEPRVREKRKQQAIFLANEVRRLGAGARVAVIGDFNAFQFSDGYVDVMGILKGVKVPDDQVVLASPDPIVTGLADLVAGLPPGEQYSYVQDGNAQVLDHILANGPMSRSLTGFAYARLNADFPESLRGDVTRAERLSDHDVPVASFALRPESNLELSQVVDGVVVSGGTLPSRVTVTNVGPDAAARPVIRFGATGAMTPFLDAAPAGWTCATESRDLVCRASSLLVSRPAVFDVAYEVACNVPDGTGDAIVAAASSETPDPEAGNDRASSPVTISNPRPRIESLVTDKSVLWPPNHQWVDVAVTYRVSDNCGDVTNALTVASSEALDGLGDGNTPVDWEVVDDSLVRLRAERSGTGAARSYTITLTSTDSAGGASTRSVVVTVPKSMGK